MMLERLVQFLEPYGLIVRGGFHPDPEDGVPSLSDGAAASTAVLIGNAGSAMWAAFRREVPQSAGANPLDGWLRSRIATIAQEAGAEPHFPNDGPPYLPVQQWAARAEPLFRSPVGIMIHPEYGLWHVYRAVLLFRDRLDLPPRSEAENPCERCEAKPCLKVCPADAFGPDRFDVAACVGHVDGPSGGNCRNRGCLARRACPVGREFVYPADQQKFHTEAMLRSARAYLSDERSREKGGG